VIFTWVFTAIKFTVKELFLLLFYWVIMYTSNRYKIKKSRVLKKYANMTTPLREKRHEWYMEQALECARQALNANEVPIGAVVVDEQGHIIARAANSMEHDCSQGSHAEIKALTQAGRHKKNWRLEGCWIYVTLEPCAMCMYACLLSRVAGIVYGAESNLYGYHLDNALLFQVYKKDTLAVVKGVCAQEAQDLLRDFFKHKRKEDLI